jgi:predicted small secreted protein
MKMNVYLCKTFTKRYKMKKILTAALVVAMAASFTGCSASMASVGGPVKVEGKKVQSDVSNMNILMLMTMSAEKAEEATQTLAKQCGGSNVVGVTSHWKTTSFYIVTMEKLSLTGYCEN